MKSFRILITAIFSLLPVTVFSQNWMMAQEYATAAIDSIVNSGDEDAFDFELCEYSYFTYNPVTQVYSLYMVDGLGIDTTATVVCDVDLRGGIATFTNDLFETYEVTLPDLSGYVYLWNATDNGITFSLSCDDSSFTDFKLGLNKYNWYNCDGDYVYIKIRTLVGGEETGQVHYKLLKGKGYKVQWDKASAKFEVFSYDKLK